MTTRTLALLTSMALLAPVLAADAFAQRPVGPRPPVVDQRGYPQDWDRNRVLPGRFGFDRERERARAAAFRDGYDAGLRAGRSNRRFDPFGESRFRSGDRGYFRNFGPGDQFRFFYRDAFRNGYERGYQEGVRSRRGSGFSIWWRW